MRIIRFLDSDGWENYGIPDGDGYALLLSGSIFGTMTQTGQRTKISKLLAPVVPCNIFCIGLNYADHAAETGAKVPEHPILFMKPTSAINHPGDKIFLPTCCNIRCGDTPHPHGPEVDFEAELAVVIGHHAHNVTEAQALQYVCGYTAANDVSARRWQKHAGGGQWVRGKGFDGFCPLGPVLVTTEDITDPQQLSVCSMLNGKTMQDGNTRDMFFTVARLVSWLSQDTTLLPGTVILTGTPAGVGFTRTPPVFLSPGDTIAIEIDGIGRLENYVVSADGDK